jgi:hypothetical protein
MFPSRRVVIGCLVLIGCLACAIWSQSDAAAPRTRKPGSGGQTGTPPGKPIPVDAEPETPEPKDTVKLTDDHEANIQALQRERLETLRKREEIIRQEAAKGNATQREIDRAAIDNLRAELDFQDRPHLRIMAWEKLVAALKRQEDEADKNFEKARLKDAASAIAAYDRYVGARVSRIRAQIDLEKERIDADQAGKKPETMPQEPEKVKEPEKIK